MKKSIACFIVLCLVACSPTKSIVEPTNEIGNYKINKDKVSIITPYIEIKEKSNNSFIKHPDKQKALTDLAIGILKSKYPNADYVEIPFLFEDYKTINSKIEGRGAVDEKNVPNELVSIKNSNSIFISMNCYFGDINRGVIMLYIIDNENKKWKMIERYPYSDGTLKTKRMEKIILRSLEKIKITE